jgi:hypothetical protein
MTLEHVCDTYCHGAVEKNRQVGYAIFQKQFIQIIEDFLGSLQSKAGHNYVPPGSPC